MDRTFVGDLEQLGALFFRELTGDRDLPLDPVEHALFRLTLGAVVGVGIIHRLYFPAASGCPEIRTPLLKVTVVASSAPGFQTRP
jgi:hypothetical protein